MKKKIDQPNSKPKLSLNKQTIAKLSIHDMLMIEGGDKGKPQSKTKLLADDPCTSGPPTSGKTI